MSSYTQAESDYVVDLWWYARKIDADAADYLVHQIDDRVQHGRSMDCDELRALTKLAAQAKAW